MFDQHRLILALLTGFLSGFILSVPVGPVNLTIINEGARSGLLWATMIGLGASAMEVIYCTLAFTGFASFFTGKMINAAIELVSFVFMLYLGIRFLRATRIQPIAPVEAQIKTKVVPHSAFAIGFVRVLGNPGVFLFWIVLAAHFRSREWVPASREGVVACVAGVGAATVLWFSGLSYAVSCRHKQFTERTLLRMEHVSGIAMLALAVVQGIYIVVKMTHYRP
jgi:threonine/homoserine/homoserine lactone efflux protein